MNKDELKQKVESPMERAKEAVGAERSSDEPGRSVGHSEDASDDIEVDIEESEDE